jgi:hypothetical protein
MNLICKIQFLFIFIITSISCSLNYRSNDLPKLYIVSYKIYKLHTNKDFIGAFTFIYSNDEDTLQYILNHQKNLKISNSNYRKNHICTDYKLIAPHKKTENLLVIREVFCKENNFNIYSRKQLDSIEQILSKDVRINLSFFNEDKNIMLSKSFDENDQITFDEITNFNPNDWFDTNEIDTLMYPPPPPVYIIY